MCQYVKSTSSKKNEGKKYIYYFCHRSFAYPCMIQIYIYGYPVAFCFLNKSDTALFKHYFQCIKNAVRNITAAVFMSDDESAFYNV